MTSEVMIMNRQAVVLAADSAVTYGGGPEPVVTLEAEKILPINKSIAVMVYARGDVLGRSWSHIVHAFAKEIGGREFASVPECAEAFFAFLDRNRVLFPESEEAEEFEELMRLAFLTVLDYARALRSYPGASFDTDEAAFIDALDTYRGHLSKTAEGRERPHVESLNEITRERFAELYGELIDRLIGEALGEFGRGEAMRARLHDFAYMLATRNAFLEPFAGLVFAGFGEKDIFPVYAHYYASILVDGVMKRAHDETTAVGVADGPNAFVRTFAQADMTHAFLRGVHPMMFDMMVSMNMAANEAAAEMALRESGLPEPEIGAMLGKLNQTVLPRLAMEYVNAVQAVSQEEFVGPFINVVGASGKRQLAETAKALVELNILQSDLHMAQTGVGGDVDVAMITRTAGLEWHASKT